MKESIVNGAKRTEVYKAVYVIGMICMNILHVAPNMSLSWEGMIYIYIGDY